MWTQIVVTSLLVGLSIGGPLSRLLTAEPRADDFNYRLPTHVEPLSYTVRLTPDFATAKFTGFAEIKIKVNKASNNITLHNRQLDLRAEDIRITGGTTQIEVVKIQSGERPDQEFSVIVLNKELEEGKEYVISIWQFTGTLNNENQGFYLAQYKDANGITHKFATTQFEPTAARRAFPCFDEPALKAKFKIFLTIPNNLYMAVSNTPIEKNWPVAGSDQIEVEFKETVPMSTYLLAFIVAEMQYVTKGTHRVIARPQAIKEGLGQYALDTGIKILNEIGNFVGITYSLEKMDQAAIPDTYFSAGAMENWGLVTYRETYLLKSKKSTTTSMHQTIATIIAHEFGHQWFGNFVSPKWWEFIWLNEGFATYFEHLGASLAEPTWRIMDQFLVRGTQYAFGPDGLNTTRAMNHKAGSPKEISALFDRIAYEKSGSVIRMIEAFLTTPVFRKGLKYYLESKPYSSATPFDLYDALQRAVTENKTILLPDKVSKIMESWDSQKGYPVINVIRNYTLDKQEEIFLNQSRFFLKNATTDDRTFWTVPLNFATKTNLTNFNTTNAEQWLTKKEDTKLVKGLLANDWLIINKQETGYYRVNYDEINWKMLIDALVNNLTSIHVLNRAQLLDDSFNLARSGRLSYSIPFQLSLYLSKETDYIPFYSFFTAANFLHTMLPGSPAHSNFKLHVLEILHGVHEHLGFDEKKDDTHLDKLNRVNVFNWLCNLGDNDCRQNAVSKFRNWKNNESMPVPLDLQGPVYCGAMRIGNQDDWDFLYSEYKDALNTEDSALRSRIRTALGCSENTKILEHFIKNSTATGSIIRPQDAFAAIYNSGSIGVTFAFDYVTNNFVELHKQLKDDGMATILNGIGSKLTTNEQLTRLKDLSEKNSAQKTLFKSAIGNAEENVNWNTVYLSEITTWLGKYSGSGNAVDVFPTSFAVILSYLLYRYVS